MITLVEDDEEETCTDDDTRGSILPYCFMYVSIVRQTSSCEIEIEKIGHSLDLPNFWEDGFLRRTEDVEAFETLEAA